MMLTMFAIIVSIQMQTKEYNIFDWIKVFHFYLFEESSLEVPVATYFLSLAWH